jgi:hypothetical protein
VKETTPRDELTRVQSHHTQLRYRLGLISSSQIQIPLEPLPLYPTKSLRLVFRAKVDADTVHTMPLILWISKPLALENVPQMSAAVIAHNLRPHAIRLLSNRARHSVPESGPAAARVKLVVCLVERRVAARTAVHAGGRVVLIKFAGSGVFSAFLAQDTKLLCGLSAMRTRRDYERNVPGDNCVCHSPSGFWTG